MTNLLLFILLFSYGEGLNKFLKHFETLSYRLPHINRVSRSANDSILVHFHAYDRDFKLILGRLPEKEAPLIEGVTIEYANETIKSDWESNIYKGKLEDDEESYVYGSIHDGIFEGMIRMSNEEEFWIESSFRYNQSFSFHSFIYSTKEIVMPSPTKNTKRSVDKSSELPFKFCEAAIQGREVRGKHFHVHNLDMSFKSHSGVTHRTRKSRSPTRDNNGIWSNRLCTLLIQVDHLLYNWAFKGDGKGDHLRTRNYLITMLTREIDLANSIFMSTDFNGIRGVQFKIAIFKFWRHRDETGNPFTSETDSPQVFLDENSKKVNHDKFCLAYAFTYRDFEKGTQGLAYPCTLCTTAKSHADHYFSHNTGIITFRSHGTEYPRSTWHLTIAHELGHSLGSGHDEMPVSTGESETDKYPECRHNEDGYFIMHDTANPGKKKNNHILSPCSIRNISRNLRGLMGLEPGVRNERQTNCFIASDTPICGNGIVEGREVCDCGFDPQECLDNGDKCCGPGSLPDGLACKLKFGSDCSPSQGSCCNGECQLLGNSEMCLEESECTFASHCTGSSSVCPSPLSANESLPCRDVTGSCKEGDCRGSVCAAEGMEECESTERTCIRHCISEGVCKSTTDLPQFTGVKYHQKGRWGQGGLLKEQGEFCKDGLGRCDSSDICEDIVNHDVAGRESGEGFQTFGELLTNQFWILIFIVLLAIAILGLSIKFCYCRVIPESSDSQNTSGFFSRVKAKKNRRKNSESRASNSSQGSQDAPHTSELKKSERESSRK